ncbi:SagB/ThcOx family dehydrogenase [Chloroflexota bacterium]
MNKELPLPRPNQEGRMSLEEAIAQRRSVRGFSAEPVTLTQLSQVLWAAQGTTDSWGSRAAPSAGATYPLEVFVACGVGGVQGLDAGVYHYIPVNHKLVLEQEGDTKAELARAALDQEYVSEAPVDIVICADYPKTLKRYGSRGERYVHMEVGHAGQNICLEATALGLATVVVGAFNDDSVRGALRLERRLTPLYIMPVGVPTSVA